MNENHQVVEYKSLEDLVLQCENTRKSYDKLLEIAYDHALIVMSRHIARVVSPNVWMFHNGWSI